MSTARLAMIGLWKLRVRSARSSLTHLVGPNLEAQQGVGTEGIADRHICRISPPRDQHPADTRHVVTGIEGVPVTVDIRLEPCGEIHRTVGRRHADVAEVTGAVASRNVHAAAEGDGKMRVIAADSRPLVEGFQGGPRRARVLVAKGDVAMDVIADRLDAAR